MEEKDNYKYCISPLHRILSFSKVMHQICGAEKSSGTDLIIQKCFKKLIISIEIDQYTEERQVSLLAVRQHHITY